MMLTMKRRCKSRKGGSHTIRSFDSADTTTGSMTIDLDQHKDLQTSTSASRGHASDDDCKRRRKENRKQRKREKRKAKEEAREKRHASTGDGPGTNNTASVEQEEQDAPRNDGSWLSTSLTSPSPLSSTDTDDSELSGQHATVSTSASWSIFESSSTERSLEGRLHKSEPSSVKKGGRLDFLSNVHVPASISNIGDAKRVEVRRVHLLYNPWSGNKKGEKKMRKARRLLERQGKEVTVTKLLHKGHAEELCESMDLTGIDVLCSVGGDGTFHECVNGIMKRINKSGKAAGADNRDNEESGDGDEHGPAAERIPPLAFIAAGTGNSFVHELGCARMRDAVRHICRGIEVGIDLSRLTYGEDECYSFNSIHWGIGSRVVDTAEKFRWMGNSVRYIMAALVELMKGNDSRVRMTITDEDDNEIVWDEEYALGIANSIITAGKGMKMAPTAKIDDGLIDLLLFTSKSPKDLLAVLRRFYNGTHTDLPHVRYIKAKKFTVTPYKYVTEESESGAEEGKQKKKGAMKQSTPRDADEDAATDVEAKDTEWSDDEMIEVMKEMVDIDGELKGFAPFTCEVLPRAIQVIL